MGRSQRNKHLQPDSQVITVEGNMAEAEEAHILLSPENIPSGIQPFSLILCPSSVPILLYMDPPHIQNQSLSSRGPFQIHNTSFSAKPSGAVTRQLFSQRNLLTEYNWDRAPVIFPDDYICRWDPNWVIYQQCCGPPVCQPETRLFSTHMHVHLGLQNIHHHNNNLLNTTNHPPPGGGQSYHRSGWLKWFGTLVL